jgi:hypothetical protein
MMMEAIIALCFAKFSHDLGLQSIILEGDSLQVINAFNEEGPSWSK